MYTIGQFSKIGKVSTKALRYYDEIDLLKPVHVNRENQYRYYSDEQVSLILLVSELKEYGLRLEEIKVILDRQSTDLLKKFLENKIKELNKGIQKSQYLKNLIELKIKKIKLGENLMETKNLQVELKKRKSLTVISRRATINIKTIGNIIGKVFEDIYQMNLQPTGPVMTLYYDKEFDEENADIEVCIPVHQKVSTEKSNKLKEFNPGLTACTTFAGPYSRLGEAYSTVMKWIEENGYKNSGAPYDIYLAGPGTANSPDQFVTEVCFPVTR